MNKISLFLAIILKINTPRRYKQIQKCFFFIHFTRAQGILSNYKPWFAGGILQNILIIGSDTFGQTITYILNIKWLYHT